MHTTDMKPPACDTYGLIYDEGPQELPGYRNHVTELDGRAVDGNRN